jgi:hypothetical protein
VAEFCKRCDFVGVVLNELPPKASTAQIASVVTTSADFLGEVVDYTKKTVRCRQKIVDRASELWGIRNAWTNRQQVGIIAVLLWCTGPLKIPLVKYYVALSFLREQGRRMQRSPDTWDDKAVVPAQVMENIHAWYKEVLLNRDTPIDPVNTSDDYILITDASEWGWGAAWMGVSSTSIQFAQMPWAGTLHGANHSTTAEPEAVWRAICRFFRPTDRVNVCLMSDHDPFVRAVNRGHSAAAVSNGVLGRIADRFPGVHLRAVFTPGRTNPTDELSRQPATAGTTDRARRGVWDILGSGAAQPLRVPATGGAAGPSPS